MRRVEWGPAITGAFCAVAIAIVLGLFGASFGLGGLRTLSGVWQVVTPLVATFIGSIVAVTMSDRRDAYPSGLMVWCISLVAGALLVGAFFRMGSIARNEFTGTSAALALAGLSAILGLVGAVIGSAAGVLVSRGRTQMVPARFTHDEASLEHPVGEGEVAPSRPAQPTRTEPPALRH